MLLSQMPARLEIEWITQVRVVATMATPRTSPFVGILSAAANMDCPNASVLPLTWAKRTKEMPKIHNGSRLLFHLVSKMYRTWLTINTDFYRFQLIRLYIIKLATATRNASLDAIHFHSRHTQPSYNIE